MNRRLLIAAALTCLGGSVEAQNRDAVTLDATIGSSHGAGGRRSYYDAAAVSGELVLGFRRGGAATEMFALTLGGSAKLGHGDSCRLLPGQPGCAPQFPDFAHFGALVGVNQALYGITFRALAGPAFFGGNGSSGMGGELFADAAAGFPHLAVVAAARGKYVARFNGERFRFGSLEFGLRLR